MEYMLLTILVFVIILSVLVLIHELGHFIVARFVGVKVEEFGFGLPPRIFGKRIHGVIYSINWLPIGGFVKLAGEDEEEESGHKLGATRKQYFFARSKKERSAILLAGVVMNFLLAVGITTYLLTQGVQEPSGQVHVESVLPGTPAFTAGIHKGDIIKSVLYHVDGQPKTANVFIPSDLISVVKGHAGEQVSIEVLRDGKLQYMTVTPRKEFPKGEGPTGITISDLETHVYPLGEAPVVATKLNFQRAWDMLAGIGGLIVRLVQLKPVGGDVAGPIGIAQVTGQAVKFGWKAVLEFMSILSLNLAVLNILPIPALDGGRLAFVFLEKILGKKVKPAFEQSTHQIGMIILFILIILISINDILRLARGG